MTIHIKAGTGKKLGLPGSSSASAWLEIETELSSDEIEREEQFKTKIDRLFRISKETVDEQLRLSYRELSETDTGTPATQAQIKAIHELSQSRNLDLDRLLEERYFGQTLEELTTTQAGQLMNWLQTSSRISMN